MTRVRQTVTTFRLSLSSVVLLVASVASCGGGSDTPAPTSAAQQSVTTVGAENVAVATATDLRSGPAISGTLQPVQQATVRAQVAGPIERTFVEAGERVKRGQLLARIDAAAVRDAYLSAKSGVRTASTVLETAQRNQERAERLRQAGAVAERDLESASNAATSAEGGLADAQARLATAGKQLGNTEVRAPFDGVVSSRAVNAGDVVQVGAALVSVVNPARLRLEAQVPGEQVGRVRVGTPVEFTVGGFERRFTGTIERINPVVDSATRQVRIYVAVPNQGGRLVGGLFAEGRVATDSRRAVAVPIAAVDARGTSPVVHRIRSGRVGEVAVQLGVRDETAELIQVRTGVAEGDTVLMGSAQGIASGSPVQVLQDEAGR